ncbi:hypothetical protein SLV14_006029 [Streptomyces sp. Je 1-4]|uniref:hypothetical protein n=1 Tax=Streptomyces TaxID=1883 RepID=UPI00140ECF00|nr:MULTISPECIES: hypothetical protein [unclassified Streptomyces]QIK04695.1 hypothetical protein G7Z12_28465 [Streptomyces sp. ID38640]UYB45113.1 hypothetical protein SLV14_006029 [Streptomyces sp. Je 1-4]UZQ39447.1 hypothetical protein SLV14N_006029 [Streptomyces sp. Je 1-4] [Streptomyces sp. Je 1-4 4N24]UZQ46864.1 hypothetical protein SLV14NA_006029 [Streptomyces sp. Je 1-4] [Streptomyces sp. Je 1-4 4N24_ara]
MSTRTGRPARAPHSAAPSPTPRTAARTVLPTPLMSLTYAVQMIVGTMVAVAGAHFFAEREAARCD